MTAMAIFKTPSGFQDPVGAFQTGDRPRFSCNSAVSSEKLRRSANPPCDRAADGNYGDAGWMQPVVIHST